MSSEISAGKFPEICSNLSGNVLIIYINLSRSLFFNFMHYVQKKITPCLAKLPGISAIRIKMIDAITSRLLVIFPENFRKY